MFWFFFSSTTCSLASLICGSLARGGGVCMTRWRRWQLRGNCDPDQFFYSDFRPLCFRSIQLCFLAASRQTLKYTFRFSQTLKKTYFWRASRKPSPSFWRARWPRRGKAMLGCIQLGWLCCNCKRLPIKSQTLNTQPRECFQRGLGNGLKVKNPNRGPFHFWPEVPEQPDHLNVDLVSFPSHSVHQNRSIVSLRSERDFVEWKRKCKDRNLTTPMLPPTRPVSHLNIQDVFKAKR